MKEGGDSIALASHIAELKIQWKKDYDKNESEWTEIIEFRDKMEEFELVLNNLTQSSKKSLYEDAYFLRSETSKSGLQKDLRQIINYLNHYSMAGVEYVSFTYGPEL
ncbi:MAG: hypothetical protein AAFP89_25995 [Bacteroidota bacterium]